MTEKQKSKIRKNNMKLYPIYQMFGLDFMFYYAIRTLFFIQVKNIPVSDVVLLSSIYAFFAIILRIPALYIVEKIGKRNSLILGNVINIAFISIVIFCTGFEQLIIAQLLSSLSDALRNTASPSLLKASVPKAKKGSDIYAKIEGKGYSKYAYFQAITDLLSGILYDVNPYIPFIFCFSFTLITTILSFRFKEIKPDEDDENNEYKEENKKEAKQIINDIVQGFKFIIKSNRLKALFLMLAAIWGMFCFTTTYMTTLFENLNCTATFIGLLSAIMCISKGIAAKKENKFHEKFRNKTLTIIGESIAILLIVIGISTLINIPFIIQILIAALSYIAIESFKGIYQISRKRYMTNFTVKNMTAQIYSANGIISNVSGMIGAYVASLVLAFTNIRLATFIMGATFLLIIVCVSKYMKPRIGLKPEEYSKQDIGIEIKQE